MQNQKWYHNDTEEKYFIEGTQPQGWRKGRLPRKSKLDIMIERISKEDLYKYYIIENHTFKETEEKFLFDIGGKLNQILTYYGIHKDPKKAALNNHSKRSHDSYVQGGKKSAETQKEAWSKKPQEEKDAWSKFRSDQMANRTDEQKESHREKIKASWFSKSEEERKEINQKRSISCKKTWSNPDLIKKQHETYKKNKQNRKCRSIAEQVIYEKLISLYPDLIYDKVIDDRYPFYVDFYIPSLDLFIEYNAHPSHGNYPYIEDDKLSLEECYKLYGDWLDVYINRDPKKVKAAIQSNLNYLIIYPSNTVEMNYQINDNKYTEIIDLILQ